MNNTTKSLFLSGLLLISGFLSVAAYASDDGHKGTIFEDRWYVSPMFTYLQADGGRDADNGSGIGGKLAIGQPASGNYSFEIDFTRDIFDLKAGGGIRHFGAGLNILRRLPTDTRVEPYLLIGVGALSTDTDLPGGNSTNPYGSLGAGLFAALPYNAMFRMDVRWRMDTDSTSLPNKDPFTDILLNVGFVIPFGDDLSPKKKVIITDSDNDGVVDASDRCPNTPNGIVVDSKGCELDDDGDGVVNSQDRCPNTPSGVQVNRQGCELDDDRDGVVNSQDRCPNTPSGVEVDPQGCELDGDNDGVVNSQDRCPNTVADVQVDGYGCERDDDEDGVVNRQDQCPNTPYGAQVDSLGCELDDDEDGIVNSKDRCLGTPMGTKVDQSGCELKEVITLRGVTFQSNSTELADDSASQDLQDAASTLLRYPAVQVLIVGHTDSIGSAAYNLRLSIERANAIKNYFTNQGVNASNLKAEGKGEAEPIASNNSKEGRASNRRVELHILDES